MVFSRFEIEQDVLDIQDIRSLIPEPIINNPANGIDINDIRTLIPVSVSCGDGENKKRIPLYYEFKIDCKQLYSYAITPQ
jgi:hypothetical protein